jgi:hypothetical protein
MLEISNVKVYDLKESVIACRNAMRTEMPEYTEEEFEKSLPRAIQLANTPSGSGHQNWLKGVRVSFDIKYPNYISPELQRYNFIDIVSSSSKMHKLMSMDLDFACNKYVPAIFVDEMKKLVDRYKKIKDTNPNFINEIFLFRDGSMIHTIDKKEALYLAFMKCISSCPQGIELFMRCSTNYLQIRNIVKQRHNHKLKEDWGAFIDFAKNLPYANEFILDVLK